MGWSSGMRGAVHVHSYLKPRIVLGVCCSLLFITTGSLAQDADRGKPVYDQWCAGCHGDTGAGDGYAAAFMLPRPRDFTRAFYQIRTTASGELPTDADIRRMIDEGMPGTAMPGWRDKLTGRERDDLVAYLKSFSSFFDDPAPDVAAIPSAPGVNEAGLEEGAQVYQDLECFRCHGDAGRGNGRSAPTLTDDWDFPVRAADLSENWNFNGGGTTEDIFWRFWTGLDGTPMPSFTDAVGDVVTEDQLWRLAQYVRSLSPDEPPEIRDVIEATLSETGVPSGLDDAAWDAAESFYVPLVGQIILKPRWFSPMVDGVWVQAIHDGERLAMKLTWHEPTQSPDPSWDEWLGLMRTTMTDVDGVLPSAPGPDIVAVQFPLRDPYADQMPYFLGGDNRRPTYQWRWTSAPDQLEEGRSTGWGQFATASSDQVRHTARFDDGEWQMQITRSLVARDTSQALSFEAGQSVPIAFYAADGSNGEDDMRGAVSAWYYLYLGVPTPSTVYITPLIAVMLTAGLGFMVVWRAQSHARQAAPSGLEE